MPSEFENLEQAAARGPVAILDRLIEQLRGRGAYHELFEALKMRLRGGLGLPLTSSDAADQLDGPKRDQLEAGLVAACREVGTCFLQAGQIREGWMYLRPVGDVGAAAAQLAQIEAAQDNIDELIEVCLHEGVDVRRGYQLVLDHYGTCNAITTYESVVTRLPRADQQAAAELLVEHVHQELWNSVAADIGRREGTQPSESTLLELVAHREWLFGEHSYHIDTTHLASTVRCVRVLETPAALRTALDLTEYGRRLAKPLQYSGEEPFQEIYPSTALYLSALLGRDVPAALEFFGRKAETLPVEEHGSLPLETYVQLLDRLGLFRQAIDALIQFAERTDRTKQIVPLLLELCGKLHDYTPALEFCSKHGELLGFGTALANRAR